MTRHRPDVVPERPNSPSAAEPDEDYRRFEPLELDRAERRALARVAVESATHIAATTIPRSLTVFLAER
jgi:hypothetical protein